MSAYQERVLAHTLRLITPLGHLQSVLDFGCGSGWYARALTERGIANEIKGVEVQRRKETYIEPILYDGVRLPFEDRRFDLVYAMDVIHHCPSPTTSLVEAARCARKYFLLKDHVHFSIGQKLLLTMLDELGNRKFGIPSPGNYQKAWEWLPVLTKAGFKLETLVHPSPCNGPLLDSIAAPTQFLALWSRVEN